MKKIYLAILASVLIISAVSLIAFAQTNGSTVIKNKKLKITLAFPPEWGVIKQKVFVEKASGGLVAENPPCSLPAGRKIADVATFSSQAHEGLNVAVWRVKKKLQSCFENSYGPFTLLKKKGKYAYYWSAVEAPAVCYPEPDETIQESYKELCELWSTRDSVRDSFSFTKKKLITPANKQSANFSVVPPQLPPAQPQPVTIPVQISGTIVDDNNTPVPHATVQLYYVHRNAGKTYRYWAVEKQTNTAGTFAISENEFLTYLKSKVGISKPYSFFISVKKTGYADAQIFDSENPKIISSGVWNVTGTLKKKQNTNAPREPIPAPQSPLPFEVPGFKTSSIGRSILTEIVVDTDSYPNVSDADLNEFFRIANNILVVRTDIEMRLAKIRNVSYKSFPEKFCSGCRTDGTSFNLFNEIYKNEPEPEYIIFFIADTLAATHGGFSVAYQSKNPAYRNHFKSAQGSTNRVYVNVADWNHMFGSCGYDRADPVHPVHVSNVSIGGECRNRPGTACILRNNYYQCNDPKTLAAFASRNRYAFAADTAVHELMHQFGTDGAYDHFGTEKCIQAMGGADYIQGNLLKTSELFAGICPKVFENFKNSYQ